MVNIHKTIYIFFIALFFTGVSCEKETETKAEGDSLRKIYNYELKAKPLKTEQGTFMIVNSDTISFVLHINTTGEVSKILNINEYLPANYTLDSLKSFNLHNTGSSICHTFEYSEIIRQDTLSKLGVIELNTDGIINQTEIDITESNNDDFDFQQLSKNTSNEYILLFTNEVKMPSIRKLTVRYCICKTDGSTQISEYTFGEEEQQIISTDNNGRFIILKGKRTGGGIGGGLFQLSDLNISIMDKEGQHENKPLDVEIAMLSNLVIEDDKIMIFGISEITAEERPGTIILLDNDFELIEQMPVNVSYSVFVDGTFIGDELYLIGCNFDRPIDWNSVYDYNSYSYEIMKLDASKNVVWHYAIEKDATTISLGVQHDTDNNLYWISSHLSYNHYKGISIFKTDSAASQFKEFNLIEELTNDE